MPTLLEDLTFENIPERIGGGFKLYNEPFEFDIAPGGALYCEQHEKKIKSSNSNDIGNKRNHNHVTQRGSKDQLHLSIDTDTPARSLVARNSSSNESSGSSRRPPPSAFPRKTEIPWPETPPTTPFAGAGGSGGSGGGAGSERHLSGTSVGGPASRTAAATLLYPRVQRAGRLSVISAKRPYSAFFYSSPQTPPGPEPESSSFSRSPPLQSRDNNNNNSNHPLAPQSAPCDDAERATDHHPARQEWLAQEESQSTVSSLSTVTDFAAETSFREDCGESVKSKINTSQQQGIAERFLLKSGNIEPNAPISHTNSPNLRSEASVPVMEEQWLVVSIFFSIFGSIWKEWCEFLSSLCVVCTQYPFKTIAVVSIIALFCYLRCLDKLHLMAFPVLFLSALTYFELFR